MFERFTDRARRVVVNAQEEARALNHNFIGTEHLMLGLLRDEEGVAAEALDRLNIKLGDFRDEVKHVVGTGPEPVKGHIPFTPAGKKVLERSLREALQLGHNYIGTEHILLALVHGDGRGVEMLARQLVMDGDREAAWHRVRHVVILILNERAKAKHAAVEDEREIAALDDSTMLSVAELRSVLARRQFWFRKGPDADEAHRGYMLYPEDAVNDIMLHVIAERDRHAK